MLFFKLKNKIHNFICLGKSLSDDLNHFNNGTYQGWVAQVLVLVPKYFKYIFEVLGLVPKYIPKTLMYLDLNPSTFVKYLDLTKVLASTFAIFFLPLHAQILLFNSCCRASLQRTYQLSQIYISAQGYNKKPFQFLFYYINLTSCLLH